MAPILAMPSLASGENLAPEMPTPPPAFKPLRFDEDYSSLANVTNRTDFFDPVKYIPLRCDHPDWYLTLGGEIRGRVESTHDVNFGIGAGQDSYWLQRITLLTDFHLGDRVRIFAQGVSGLIAGNSEPASPIQDDPIDLQFAFLEVVPWLTDDSRLALRAGRFGMSFGAGRLVATRAAPNILFRFDGFEALYSSPDWQATAFVTQPVRDTGGFDGENHQISFWGLYTTHWFDKSKTIGVDMYYLGIHREHGFYASGTANEYRHSFGVREFGTWKGFDWDGEQLGQFGSFGSKNILAWTAALDSGYNLDLPLRPRVGLKMGVTSGDHNPNDGTLETFDALFFKSGYFNDASLLRPQNLIGLHPNILLRVTDALSVYGGADWFWRYSKHDAVYAVPGDIAVPASNASQFTGTALDINFDWRVQRHLTLSASYVHFITGQYIHSAGGRDVDYVSTTISFLF